uniref:FBD domain-containing protein n=1 Tax=Aegilops tauschii TaxID=37682 RepID=R7W0F2_AEGTA
MELRTFRFTQLPAREFSALERLCLRGCTIINLVTILALCPRLRVLKVMADRSARDVKINSESLQELDLSVYGVVKCQGLQIMTPLLKQLKLKVCSNPDLRVSISTTPMVEKVSWLLTYNTESSLIFGFWSLQSMRLETIGSYKYNDGNRLGAAMDFAPEMEKLPVANFTVLELHLNAMGHVLGGLLRHLLMMHQIQTATQRLKVFLWDWSRANCLENCPCDEPKNWRSQSISLTRLEEVEINNFRGRGREMDLVTVALRWAPRLKTMTIKLADETGIERCATNIYNICLAYPSVNCSVYCHSGRLV